MIACEKASSQGFHVHKSAYVPIDNVPIEHVLISIEKGINFIKKNQFDSGEFPTYVSEHENMENPRYAKTICMTILVPSTILSLRKRFKIDTLLSNSVNFLLREKEDFFKWRSLGKGSNVSPDLDDIAYALSFFKLYGIELNYRMIGDFMLRNRNENFSILIYQKRKSVS